MKVEKRFRAYHKSLNIMIPFEEMSCHDSMKEYGQRATLNGFLNNPDYEVMQFTGLSDRSSIQIYEGDIIDAKYKWVVVFENGAFYAKNKYAPAYLLLKIIDKRRRALCPIEVIGNIYQNPELLKSN